MLTNLIISIFGLMLSQPSFDCNTKFESKYNYYIFVYQAVNAPTLYQYNFLTISNDTIYRQSMSQHNFLGHEKVLEEVHNNYSSMIKYGKRDGIIKTDTLLFLSDSVIVKIGEKYFNHDSNFINPLAPSYTEHHLDTPFTVQSINYNVYIEKPTKFDSCQQYTYHYINPFESHTQYTYVYQKDFWITQYKYNEYTYDLVYYEALKK